MGVITTPYHHPLHHSPKTKTLWDLKKESYKIVLMGTTRSWSFRNGSSNPKLWRLHCFYTHKNFPQKYYFWEDSEMLDIWSPESSCFITLLLSNYVYNCKVSRTSKWHSIYLLCPLVVNYKCNQNNKYNKCPNNMIYLQSPRLQQEPNRTHSKRRKI